MGHNALLRLLAVTVAVTAGTICRYSVGARAANQIGFPLDGQFSVAVEYALTDSRDVFEHDDRYETSFDSEGYFFRVSYGVIESVAVDVRLGERDFDFDGEDFDFGRGSAWGLGFRSVLKRHFISGWELGAGVQYLAYEPDDSISVGVPFSAEADEWQMSIDVARTFSERYTVCFGAMYNEFNLRYEHPSEHGPRRGGFEEDTALGVFAGAEVEISRRWSASAEVQVVARTAVNLSIGYRF